ncbi:MAG: hypothetical protein NWP87_02025, partial [Winogradskyella sp.]|nr:hypothetical protein [Winogradskyella sp.]
MKVLIVNTYDNGGAANACIRLHMALIDKSIDSQLLTSRSLKFCKNTTVLKPRTKTLGFFERLNILIIKVLINFRIISEKTNEREQFLDKRKEENLEIFTFPDSDYDITESQLYKEADIINLHWVAGFLDYTSFFEKNKKPIVWTLHDMNPILGGEHYKETYCGIDNSGNIKNRVISETERQYEQSIFAIKKRALNNKANITIVSPSQWLLNEGTQSTIFAGYPSYCIPNGI